MKQDNHTKQLFNMKSQEGLSCCLVAVNEPVVELVNVLDVSENNVVFVAESWRHVLRAARHLPQIRLY